MKKLFLGCIADDFTGATDLANNLVRAGMRVVQTIDVPDVDLSEEADAVVVALKSRTIAPDIAVAQSLNALSWLKRQGAEQIYFKYCSTFDSTPAGNIGPVTDALMRALKTDFTIACPAFPENGRTVFKGYLFAGDQLLQESGMRNHPLTPMTDSNLVRVLQSQTPSKVGLIDYTTVSAGPEAIAQRIEALKSSGVRMAVVDATSNADLMRLGPALKDLPLVTAGSGVAIGLPQNFAVQADNQAASLPVAVGPQAIVSGSCSTATLAQVADFIERGGQAFAINPMDIAEGQNVVANALAWAKSVGSDKPLLVYASAQPEAVREVQSKLGVGRAGELVEDALATIAAKLVQSGVRQLIVAGGETSGACVRALGINTMRIGPQIAPGVPWCYAHSTLLPKEGLHVTLKSGNFGNVDFFTGAFGVLA